MFALRSAPLWLEPDGLESLRLSLNAPVVDGADLPTGPARAALVVHRERSGRLGVTVGVRSEHGGQVALYTLDETLDARGVDVAVDAALSFGESLGFLFDDEELERGGRRRALRLWQERIGSEVEPEIARGGEDTPVPRGRAPVWEMAADDEPDELVLEDLVDQIPLSRFQASHTAHGSDARYFGEIDLEGEAASPGPSPPPPPSAPATSGVPLSKFRAPAAEPAPGAAGAAPAPRRARLARVRLVRRARPQEDSGDPDRILRLLAAF